MPRSTYSKARLLALKRILERRTDERHPLTVPKLIAELERLDIPAERKAVYDDIRALQEDGLDIINDQHGYYVGSRQFQLSELKLLVDAVQSSKFITQRKSDELIAQLAALSSEHEEAELRRQVHVAGRIKSMNETIYYNIDSLSSAIAQRKQVSFRYFNWQVSFEGSSRFVKSFRREGARYRTSPWALFWASENYYLVAYDEDSGTPRHYRVDKMEDIRTEREPRLGTDVLGDFDPAEYSREVFGMFGGEARSLIIRFKEQLAGVVADRFGLDVFVSSDSPGWFRARVEAVASPQFFGWLAALEGGAEIAAPDDIRDEYRAFLLRALGQDI